MVASRGFLSRVRPSTAGGTSLELLAVVCPPGWGSKVLSLGPSSVRVLALSEPPAPCLAGLDLTRLVHRLWGPWCVPG